MPDRRFVCCIQMTSSMDQLDLARPDAVTQSKRRDAPHDPALDDIARVAAQVCQAPVALVSLLEGDGFALPGQYGIELASVPAGTLPWDAATHATIDSTMDAEGAYQIPDARHDPAYAATGIVLGERSFRSYAGCPVQTAQGATVGWLSVFDSVARKLSSAQRDALEAMSRMVATRLEVVTRVQETDRAAGAQERVEAALKVERNFVAAVLDTVGALVVVFDTAGRIVRFNRACEIISGYAAGELLGKFAWERLIPEEDVPGAVQEFERIRQGEFPATFENHWLSADGTRRHISWSATALLDSRGEVGFLIATGLDVTVQRVAEGAMRESEALYRQIVEGSLGLVCTHDLAGRVLSINAHGAQSLGRTVADVVGQPLADLISSQRQGFLEPYIETLLATGEAQGLMHLGHSNGEERVLAYRNRLVEPTDGPRYVLGFAIDITEQVRAEEQLHALIRQSDSVLESVGDGIYGIDLEGRVTVVNPAAAGMLGYRPEELLGRNMHALIHHTRADGKPYPEADCPIRGSLQHLNTVRVSQDVFWHKDGRSFPVEYVARPQLQARARNGETAQGGEEERAVGVVVAFTDISERYALDRMKDEFISTVSHELRTPLTSIRAALGLVAGGALQEKPEKAQHLMDIAVGNTDRLVRLVNDILDLERIGSGKAQLHFCNCSMEEIFRRAILLLEAAATKTNVRFTVEPNDVVVWCDPDRVLQTVTNLLSNAIKFSPEPTALPNEIRLTAVAMAEGEEARVEVQDHGRGIPANKLVTIFERFKQVDASDTRSMGGTGLGLAICKSIVTQHGGQIWATSALGEGTTIHFTLPMQPQSHLR